MNYHEEARALVRHLNQSMGPSPYDIAWLARLKEPGGSQPRWPDLVNWLLAQQSPDGSWGGQIPYYHDRVICTLSAIVALGQNGQTGQVRQAITMAEHYLWHNLHLLNRDPFELVGFELLFPTLLSEAQMIGLDVPRHLCGYGKIQAEKLRLIPPDLLYSPHISTIHSLEFLGQDSDVERMHLALASNGSLGNSPAATAYYLVRHQKEEVRAVGYLRDMMEHLGHVIYLYPFRTFELTWALNNLAFCHSPITNFAEPGVWHQLSADMGANGIGLDKTFGITDGDITSVTTRLLVQAGYNVEPAVLARFEDNGSHVFRTYDYERNISVGTNLHALEAVELLADCYPNHAAVSEEIIITLLDNRIFNTYWIDKWHTSPYYATSHVMVGLLRSGTYLTHELQYTADWLVHTQRPDGSWGFFNIGTAEETAYALIALLHFHQDEPVDKNVLHAGAAYLAERYLNGHHSYPELWIGKCLYVPYDVVRSAILAALILYEDTFGRQP
jgi:halimadienyl-diphosphate synthase